LNRALSAVFALALLTGCRGQPSEDPPIHIIPDMDWQPKYQPQGESKFFPDGRAMRQPVEGTVAVGELREDDAFYRGKRGDAWVGKAPIQVNAKTLARGEERFGIYCAPCHDKSGSGKGIVVQRGFALPPALYADHARGLPDGELFDIITHGVRNMPSYAAQIPVEDRWAIVTWLRVLQRSQHAAVEDVPADMRAKIEAEGTTP
jgi:mono/diheme cytochrome c family protein